MPNKKKKFRQQKPRRNQKPSGHHKRQPHHHPSKQVRDFEPSINATKQQITAWLEQGKQSTTDKVSGFELDPWQREACALLEQGSHVIVDAPTTAGKTRVVEYFFRQNLTKPGFRAAYTTPVKSLSNDKLREFRAMFGPENVGIATGDIKENLSAPIVVATLECYRNSLLGTEPDLGRSLVIFDEYHYLQDESRGSAWEESIILTPPTCQLLLLSASVANSREFCQWITTIKGKPCELVRVSHRPVPLVDLVYYGSHWLLASNLPSHQQQRGKNLKFLKPMPARQLSERLQSLIDLKLLPCIVYAGRRLACEILAEEISHVLPQLSKEQRQQMEQRLEQLDAELQCKTFLPSDLRHMIREYGVAYHHSGLAPPARIAIEMMVKKGELRFCVATMGLSLGINFSVRSALISDYERPGDQGIVVYGQSEVLQMLGRAGRRGKDAVGFSLWPSLESYQLLANAKREPCYSRLRNDPTTFLGLVSRGYNLDQVEQFYSSSFLRHRNQSLDLAIITPNRVKRKLKVEGLPCQSPASEFVSFTAGTEALCQSCKLRRNCHDYIRAKAQNDLTQLHLHLHGIGALSSEERLTAYGEIAKHFPQNGGLLVADWFAKDLLGEKNLLSTTELMGALGLARHKTPGVERNYLFPFDPSAIENQIMELYPHQLFPELYDPPFGRRRYAVLREFNPDAGFVVKLWLSGCDWKTLRGATLTEKFGEGDLMGILYRVATYLQSLAQAQLPQVSYAARELRTQILREPLSIAIDY